MWNIVTMVKNYVEILRKINNAVREYRHAHLVIPAKNESALTPTIYFFTPDTNTPAGGVLVIYRHVDLLNAAGIRAFVLHQRRGFRCTWFEHNTPVTDVRSTRVRRGDLLVVPEQDVCLLCKQPQGVRHVIFNQNSHLTWKWDGAQVIRHYINSPDLAGAIVVSDHNADMLRYAFGNLPVRRIHLGIDPMLFHFKEGPRTCRISYMPRRGSADAEKVLRLLSGRGVLNGWEVVPLEGLTHAEVAEQLRTTRIFMAFTYQEGFGLPAAEAMACGNYVVGYHGFGGREFFLPEFSAPIEIGDILSFARAVENAIVRDRANPSWCLDRGRAASMFVLTEYSLKRERNEVVSAYTELLGQSSASLIGADHLKQEMDPKNQTVA